MYVYVHIRWVAAENQLVAYFYLSYVCVNKSSPLSSTWLLRGKCWLRIVNPFISTVFFSYWFPADFLICWKVFFRVFSPDLTRMPLFGVKITHLSTQLGVAQYFVYFDSLNGFTSIADVFRFCHFFWHHIVIARIMLWKAEQCLSF